MEARPYQTETIAKARIEYGLGANAVCVVAPCGAGKTFIGCETARLADDRGRKILWLAHRYELIDQARERLTVPARVDTVQGLLASGERPRADFVVLDEAHHFGSGAAKWHQLAQDYQSSWILGLTATPQRGDGTPLRPPFDAIVVAAHYSHLIEHDWLVPAQVWAPPRKISGIAKPVQSYLDNAPGQRAVFFCSNIEHAGDVAAELVANGVRAANVDGTMPEAHRRTIINAMRDGDLDVLTNVFILTEGFDYPAIECVVLARGFSTQGAFIQAVGRALRPAPGKTHATVLDLSGACHHHGLPDEDRAYSLDGAAIRAKHQDDKQRIRQCQWCGAVFLGMAPTCPRCGRRVAIPRTPKERRTRLERVRQLRTGDARVAHWKQIQKQCRERGYKPGWAYYRFKAIYGTPPPRSCD